MKILNLNFQSFLKKINGKPLVYLDSSNSSQKPMCVINRLNDFYKNEFSNIGRSIHSLAINATNKFEETRISVKNFINANSREEIIFTKNGTEAINLVATTFGQQNIKKGDEIIITELEHHSNYVPWHFLRATRGAIIKFAPINEDGDIIIDKLKELIHIKNKDCCCYTLIKRNWYNCSNQRNCRDCAQKKCSCISRRMSECSSY